MGTVHPIRPHEPPPFIEGRCPCGKTTVLIANSPVNAGLSVTCIHCGAVAEATVESGSWRV